jgi:Fe-S cluster biogenesis protein NfuA
VAEQALVERVQELTGRLEQVADPLARATGEELAAAVADLYGEGLRLILATLDDAATVPEARERLTADGVVASLLLMHGLYPVALEERVAQALEEVRPYLASHGGDVRLLEITDEGVARLALSGSCEGCPSSAVTLELAVEEALRDAAPDLAGLDVAGAVARRPVPPPADAPVWVELPALAGLGRGALAATHGLVVANVAGTLLAYADRCAGCGGSLRDAVLLGGTLTCTGCGRGWDLPRAGRAKDGGPEALEPVPLLRRGGTVRVALAEPPAAGGGTCELCPMPLGDEHHHLLHLDERRILCVCSSCWAQHSGDPELRPAGDRTVLLDGAALPDGLWAALDLPIGLAFLLRSSATGAVHALYPSPAGATESELGLAAWTALLAAVPELARLEPDAEGVLVNRLADPPQLAIVPIDECYRLVGLVKAGWEGISGGAAVQRTVAAFFDGLRERAAA